MQLSKIIDLSEKKDDCEVIFDATKNKLNMAYTMKEQLNNRKRVKVRLDISMS